MTAEVKEVAGWLRLFMEPGQVTELRAIDYLQGQYSSVQAGFFDFEHLDKMASEALRLTRASTGVYFVPNPIKPESLAKCANRVKKAGRGDAVPDADVLCRRWLLFDADPVRPVANVSSTDAEKKLAWEVIQNVRNFVVGNWLPGGILADSGNGYHLICPIDAHRDDSCLVRSLLHSVAEKFDTQSVHVDRVVFNPARIVKLYGTMARKGDDTPDRPHRRSSILESVTA